MRRERRKAQPTLPNSLGEFGRVCENNVRYGMVDNKPFCRGVTGEETSPSVIFLSDQLKQLLIHAKEIHIDGTFKTRPRQPESGQLLTILVIQYGIVSAVCPSISNEILSEIHFLAR